MNAEVQSANFNLTARAAAPSHKTTRVLRWAPEAPGGPSFQFIAGPDACGSKDRIKFFRGFQVFGKGTGTYLAIVDGELVAQGSFTGTGDAIKGNQVPFPRGTAGREAIVFGAFGGELDRIAILYDPVGLVEE